MLEFIPFGNVNGLNVTGDQNCFECFLDLCSVKECLNLTTGLYRPIVQGSRSASVG